MRSFDTNLLVIFIAAVVLFFGIVHSILPNDSLPTGMATSMLQIVELNPKTCNFTVNKGWNLVGVPCFSNHLNVSLAFGSLLCNSTSIMRNVSANPSNMSVCIPYLVGVHSYEPSDPDSWKSFMPYAPSYVIQDLNFVDDMHGYFVSVKNSTRIVYHDSVSIPNTIQLAAGYNLVSYDANDTVNNRPVASSILTIQDSYKQVFSYSAGAFQKYNNTVHQFDVFQPYRGYWIEMQADGTWVIDW